MRCSLTLAAAVELPPAASLPEASLAAKRLEEEAQVVAAWEAAEQLAAMAARAISADMHRWLVQRWMSSKRRPAAAPAVPTR